MMMIDEDSHQIVVLVWSEGISVWVVALLNSYCLSFHLFFKGFQGLGVDCFLESGSQVDILSGDNYLVGILADLSIIVKSFNLGACFFHLLSEIISNGLQ